MAISSCFFLVYFVGYHLSITLPILGEKLSAPPHFQVVNVSSLLPKPYCQRSTSSGQTIGSQKLEMVSRYGPCYPNAKTPTSDPDQLLNLDQVRVRSINKRHKHPLGPITNEVNIDDGYFTVKIGLGTPRQDFNLTVDTGSESTWVRCKSCTKGCTSDYPPYDPSKSTTYTNNTTSYNRQFSVSYGDGSSVSGTWGCDTLTGDDHDLHAIMKFRFVCGQEIEGNFGDASGVLGLGRGESSVTSQIASAVQMFSYYVPLTSQVGNLYFGNKAMTRSNTCSNQFTPLVEGLNPVYYYIDLVGISVAGKKLNVSSTIFTSRGTIIDSGTVITRLPEVIYFAFRDAFRESMLSYTLLDEADKLLDTCYNLEGIEQFVLPEIKFQFGQEGTIDVTLSNGGIIWRKSDTIKCLAFAVTGNYINSIIGIVQQRGFNVLYDLKGKRIGFGTNCAAS